ncbi:phosphoenolpyruvate-protein phosphotransferase [Salmonella enterica subsp. enterica]|uniref:Phosphoenolpyruvate-protein phosphotransferase n=1 Tax=Salmonella enterica I TaxID=59201 RepID=A0A447TQJ1_SALET|nr:phosphoenolpyruvate-protein phosphotransferase [Salmonella enterica subsp. enterica]
MLEVPSVMFIIDQCCEEIDFFSIGSNDLTQYLLAVDRDNAKVTRHYNSLNPAFLRALDFAVQAVHRQGKWIGLCGETGGQRFGSAIAGRSGAGRDQHGRAVDSRRQSADGTTRQPSLPPVVESGDGLPHLAGGGASAGAVPHVAAGCPAGYRPMHNA